MKISMKKNGNRVRRGKIQPGARKLFFFSLKAAVRNFLVKN